MKVLCPYCGNSIMVGSSGRKPFNIPVTKVCDALKLHHSVLMAANQLGCSRAYIYKVLKANRLTAKELLSKRNAHQSIQEVCKNRGTEK
jgi:hypothetical protein